MTKHLIETFLIITVWKPEKQRKLAFKFEDKVKMKNEWYWILAEDFVSDLLQEGFRVICVEVWRQADGLVRIDQK